jgi:hypothetical protein
MRGNRRKYVGRQWDWCVRGWYAADVEPPKVARTLAFETVHKGESSRDMEVQAAESRPDIGAVVYYRVVDGVVQD